MATIEEINQEFEGMRWQAYELYTDMRLVYPDLPDDCVCVAASAMHQFYVPRS